MSLSSNESNNIEMEMSQEENLEESNMMPKSSNTNVGNLEECLKLLRSPIDEQRLVGLLLATKFVSGEDTNTIKQVFDAIGFDFINRLLKTAESSTGEDNFEKIEQKKAYAHLALTILNAFSKIPELASHEQMLQKIPFFVSTIQSRAEASMMQDAYDCLLSMSSSEKGFEKVQEEEVISVAATDLYLSEWDSPCIPHALNLMEILFSKNISETLLFEYKSQFSAAVKTLSKIFSEKNDFLKFKSLLILLYTLTSKGSESICESLKSHKYGNDWFINVKKGISQILHSKIDPEKKYMVLQLARIVIEIEGENWLIIPILPSSSSTSYSSSSSSLSDSIYSAERFFIIMTETLRIEIHVLLNDIEHIISVEEEERKKEREELRLMEEEKEESKRMNTNEEDEFVDDVEMNDVQMIGGGDRKHSSSPSPHMIKLQSNLSNCYFILEHVIELISSIASDGEEEEEGKKEKKEEKDDRNIRSKMEDVEEIKVENEKVEANDKEKMNENEIEMKEERDLKMERQQFFTSFGEENLGKLVLAVDDIISNILEFLHDMKNLEKNQDLSVLASIRIIGRFLAEAPVAHSKKVKRLLSFMLSSKSEEETAPIQSVQLFLPFLSQVSSNDDFCKRIVKDGGHKYIVGFIAEHSRTNITGALRAGEDAHGYLMQACEVILNIFGTREEFPHELDVHDFSPLLAAMVSWSSATGAESHLILGVCSCVIASVLDLSTESNVKSKLDNATYKRLPKAMVTIVKFLEIGNKASSHYGHGTEMRHLWDITVSSCTECLNNWPMLKRAIHDSAWWTKMSKSKPMTASRLRISCKDASIKPLMAAVAGVKLEAVLAEPKPKAAKTTEPPAVEVPKPAKPDIPPTIVLPASEAKPTVSVTNSLTESAVEVTKPHFEVSESDVDIAKSAPEATEMSFCGEAMSKPDHCNLPTKLSEFNLVSESTKRQPTNVEPTLTLDQ